MRIDIITVLPELLESPLNYSIIKRAKEKGLVEINILQMINIKALMIMLSAEEQEW
jgi:tRNA G37 N-methylase TrmD